MPYRRHPHPSALRAVAVSGGIFDARLNQLLLRLLTGFALKDGMTIHNGYVSDREACTSANHSTVLLLL